MKPTSHSSFHFLHQERRQDEALYIFSLDSKIISKNNSYCPSGAVNLHLVVETVKIPLENRIRDQT